MKQKILSILFLALLVQCSGKIKFYHGYVYGEDGVPLENIRIFEDDNLRESALTDKNGYFKLEEKNSFSGDLVIMLSDSTVIDTIKTAYAVHGERIRYQFINGTSDTIWIKVVKKK